MSEGLPFVLAHSFASIPPHPPRFVFRLNLSLFCSLTMTRLLTSRRSGSLPGILESKKCGLSYRKGAIFEIPEFFRGILRAIPGAGKKTRSEMTEDGKTRRQTGKDPCRNSEPSQGTERGKMGEISKGGGERVPGVHAGHKKQAWCMDAPGGEKPEDLVNAFHLVTVTA